MWAPRHRMTRWRSQVRALYRPLVSNESGGFLVNPYYLHGPFAQQSPRTRAGKSRSVAVDFGYGDGDDDGFNGDRRVGYCLRAMNRRTRSAISSAAVSRAKCPASRM